MLPEKIELRLRESFDNLIKDMNQDEKIEFCQTLIHTEPPQALAEFLASMLGVSADVIRDTARRHAQETLERIAH